MPHNNASAPDKQTVNTQNARFASNIGRGFYFSLPLATATLCWFNFNSSAMAVNTDAPLLTRTSNSIDRFHTDHDRKYQHYKERSGLIPRILSLITSPFRNNLETLPKADLPAREPQTIFHPDAVGGSLTQNLVPIYLSQANSLSNNKFLSATKIKAVDPVNSFIKPQIEPNKKLYTVKAGDTIASIAERHKVSHQELIALNKINDSNIIFVNQKLIVPSNSSEGVSNKTEKITLTKANFPHNSQKQTDISARELQQQRLANLQADIKRMRSEIERERENPHLALDVDNSDVASSIDSQTDRGLDSITPESVSLTLPPLPSSQEYLPEAFDGGYSWPAKGILSSGYGWRWGRLHKGIDIAAPVGTPIFAAAAGEVISAGWNSGGYGNLVKLQHLDGSITLYAHNNRVLVRNGQRVNKGEQIAEMGNTGFSTGSHLHFEIHSRNRGIVNPLALLRRN